MTASASYLNIHLEIDSDDRLRTKLCDIIDYFHTVNVPCMHVCSNIPSYGVFISVNAIFQSLWFLSGFLNRG